MAEEFKEKNGSEVLGKDINNKVEVEKSENDIPSDAATSDSGSSGGNFFKKKKNIYIVVGVVVLILIIGFFIWLFSGEDEEIAMEEQGWSDEYDQDKPLPEDYGRLVVVQEGISVRRSGTDVDLTCEECNEIEVYEGDIVKTDETGIGYIIFEDESLLSLDSETEIELETYREVEEGSYKTNIKQVLGRTWSKVQKLVGDDADYSIETSNTLASVRGTKFGCDVEPGTTSCYADAGEVLLKLKNVREELSEILLQAGKEFENDDEKMKLVEKLEDVTAFLKDYESTANSWVAFTECLDEAGNLTSFDLCGKELLEIIDEKIEELEEELKEEPKPKYVPPPPPPPAPVSPISYEWTKTAGSSAKDYAYDVAIDGSGNKYVVGEFCGAVDFDPSDGVDMKTPVGSCDGFITKFKGSDNYDWTYQIGGASNIRAKAVTVDRNGNVYYIGEFWGTADFNPTGGTDNQSSSQEQDVFFSKLNSDASYAWTHLIRGTSYNEQGEDIAVDSAGNVYVTGRGWSYSVDLDPTAGTDYHGWSSVYTAFISKLNANRTYGWGHAVGNSSWSNYGFSLAIDSSDNVYWSGAYMGSNHDFDPFGGTDRRSNTSTDPDFFLTKINGGTSYGWTQTMPGEGSFYAYAMDIGSNGNVYLGGRFSGPTMDMDYSTAGIDNHTPINVDSALMKVMSNGSYGWTKTFGGSGDDIIKDMDINATQIILTGYFNSNNVDFNPNSGSDTKYSKGGYDIFMTKMDTAGDYEWTRTIGGTGEDQGDGVEWLGSSFYTVGGFQGTDVDFDPTSGVDKRSATGDPTQFDYFITKNKDL